MTNDINELLTSKDFSELTPDEKSFALEHMTESEYASMRETLVSATCVFDLENRVLSPDENIRKNLASGLRAKNKQSSIWNSLAGILFFRVPAYQVAAILIASLIIVHYLSPAGKPVVMYSTHTDTVFVEKAVNQEPVQRKSEIKTTTKYAAKRNPAQDGNASASKVINPYAASFSNLVIRNGTDKRGTTMQSDSSLYRYLVTVQ